MCYRTVCSTCGKPTWAGCGKHIESALAGVPEAERCHCREDKAKQEASTKDVTEVPDASVKGAEPSQAEQQQHRVETDDGRAEQHRAGGGPRDIETISLVRALSGHTDRVWDIALHPTMPLIATASADKTVRLYSSKTYAHVGTIEGNHKRSIRSCAWKPGEPRPVLATGSFDGTAGIWDTQQQHGNDEDGSMNGGGDVEWECAGLLEGHEHEVKCVSWSASGTLLATCSRDKSIWVWECENYEDPECVSVMQEHSGDVKCVRWHPTEELLASGSYDDEIRIWRDDGDDWVCCAVLKGHEGTVWAIDFSCPPSSSSSSDGTPIAAAAAAGRDTRAQLVSASGDSTVRIWTRTADAANPPRDADAVPSIIRPSNHQEWVESATLPKAHQGDIYTVAWSRNSHRVASAGEDGNITIYTRKQSLAAEDNAEQQWVIETEKISAHGVYEINHLVWGPMQEDGSELLFSAGDDCETRVWSVKQST